MAGSSEYRERNSICEKPWKQKRSTLVNGGLFRDVEVFEGKPAARTPFSLDVTPVESGYTTIICANESKFLVPSKVVDSFDCVDVLLHGDGTFKERLENIIRFPDMRPEVMETVLRFGFIEHVNTLKAEKYWGSECPRLVFQFEVSPGQAMDLIHAAHFLGIRTLLSIAARMVADNLKDVSDLSSLPGDLGWCIAEQFSAEQLFDAEERHDFQVLNLDTNILWEKHSKQLLQGDIVKPVSVTNTYPSYYTWDASEGPPPTSWKSLYIATYLQQLADRQDGGENSSFMAEVSRKGKHSYSHTIRPLFWDWVLRGQGSVSLPMYTSLFTNLLYLRLSKLPLGIPFEDEIAPCIKIGDVLHGLPLLQCLDASETGLTAEAAVNLSAALQSHERIQVLRLAYNAIMTRGFSAIIQVLPSVRTLKLLDVRENEIGAPVLQHVVESLQMSALEVLLLEGNFQSVEEISTSGVVQSQSSATGNFIENMLTHSTSDFAIFLKVHLLSGMPHSIKHLYLSRCELTDCRTATLANALASLNFIQVLDLGDNKITSEGAAAILFWLQRNESLVELSLANNKITDSCSLQLSRVLCNHKCIEKLSLMGNYSYGEDNLHEVLSAAVVRGFALHLAKLSTFTLDLRSTDISYLTRGRILHQIDKYSNVLLLI
eukprot:c23305_g4_i1 orf=653-2626(+)